jgi:signal transduction histidine kinase
MIETTRWCLMLCFLCISCGLVQAEDVSNRLRIAVDVHAHFTAEQAWSQTQQPYALRLQHANQVVGSANSPPHWAAWSITPDDFQEPTVWLSLQSPTQDHSALWVRDGSGPWQLQQLREGYLLPTWVLQKQGVEKMDILLRTEGPNRVQFPLAMESPSTYVLKQQRIVLFMGAVLAVPLVVMFYAVVLIRSLQNPKLSLFLGMAFCDLMAALWVSGLLTLLWPGLSRLHASWLGTGAYWMLFVLSVFHTQSFLDTAQSNPKIHHQLRKLSWFWLCAVPLCAVWCPLWLRAFLLWGGSFHALAMIHVAWIYWRQDKSSANALFLGVWLVYLSSVVVYWMYRWLEWPLFTTLGVQFVQGAAVAALLGLSASFQVFKERQQLQQHVLVAKAKERWYAATQHDLWQPLQSVQLYAQALLEAPVHQRTSLINGLRLASQSVDDFMNHLRFLVDGDASPTDGLSIQTVEVHALLASLVSEFMPLAQMRHVLLRYRPCHAKVVIDQRAVQRMVRNLLTNALHYTPAGGRVLLICQKRAAVLWLLCIDNGVGMSKAQMDACFEAFTRFDQNHQTNKLGLGLFSFKQLAMQHQMPTRLQSIQGKGSLVGFGVPLSPEK